MTRLNVRKLKRGVLKFMVLEALSTKPMYAYEIIKYIYEKFNGLYKPSPGSIYPILKNMIKRNMIEVKEIDGKKIYEITELGRSEFLKLRENYKDVYPVDPNSKAIVSMLFDIGFLVYKYRKLLTQEDFKIVRDMLISCKENIQNFLESVSIVRKRMQNS